MLNNFRKTTLASILVGILCCGLWMLPSQAEACCIYNRTLHQLEAKSSIFNTINITSGNHLCTNGKGGTYEIFLMDRYRQNNISTTVRMTVDDHGWISVFLKNDGRWKVVNKRKDGSVKEFTYLHPVS